MRVINLDNGGIDFTAPVRRICASKSRKSLNIFHFSLLSHTPTTFKQSVKTTFVFNHFLTCLLII